MAIFRKIDERAPARRETSDFSLKRRILDKDYSRVLTAIEYDVETKTVFLLFFLRNKDGVANKYFVGRLNGDELDDIISISQKEHDFYQKYIHLKMLGFSNKAYQWSYFDIELEKLKSADYSLFKLWNHYKSAD